MVSVNTVLANRNTAAQHLTSDGSSSPLLVTSPLHKQPVGTCATQAKQGQGQGRMLMPTPFNSVQSVSTADTLSAHSSPHQAPAVTGQSAAASRVALVAVPMTSAAAQTVTNDSQSSSSLLTPRVQLVLRSQVDPAYQIFVPVIGTNHHRVTSAPVSRPVSVISLTSPVACVVK